MTTIPTIQDLAASLLDRREHTKSDRTPGLDSWVTFRDRTDWEDTLFRDAHGDMFPDDWRYEFIEDALSVIADTDETLEDYEIEEAFDEWFDGAYVYTHQITGWLHSRVDRYGYVNDWINDVGADDDIIRSLSGGMYREAREVFDSVLASLRRRVEDICAEAQDEAMSEEA